MYDKMAWGERMNMNKEQMGKISDFLRYIHYNNISVLFADFDKTSMICMQRIVVGYN